MFGLVILTFLGLVIGLLISRYVKDEIISGKKYYADGLSWSGDY